MEQHRTLYELNQLVRDAVEMSLDEAYWVEAELQDVRIAAGHCFMVLVEKSPDGFTPIARADAVCWSRTWAVLQRHFERVAGQPFASGIKVLLQVTASFHEAHGFKWVVNDVNPTFTLGDMLLRRRQIVEKLKANGIYDLQHGLSLPANCQRIAVVSSEGAAGFGDFCNQLEHNTYGLAFQLRLYPATMQGETVEPSIVNALNQIFQDIDDTDCVVIIRGGGATSDMSGFDTYTLAENIANFPLPVITGIGHQRDESIVDLVAFQSAKTPTAVAALLVEHQLDQLQTLSLLSQRMQAAAAERLNRAKEHVVHLSNAINSLLALVTTRQAARLEQIGRTVQACVEQRLLKEGHRLELIGNRLELSDPARLLQRGYSYTLKDGKMVKSAAQLQPGDDIETHLAEGSFHATVKSIGKKTIDNNQ